jgi:signal transduction histidine kinase
VDGAPTREDTVVAVACAVAGVLLVLLAGSGTGWAPVGLELAAQTCAAALLIFRTRHPVLVLSGCAVASLVSPVVAALGALHAVGLRVTSLRTSLAAVLAAVAVSWPTWLITTEAASPALLWLGILVLLAAYAAGRLQHQQAEADRRASAAAEGRARRAERDALARDLHDVVSRRMSYAVVEAEVLGTSTRDDEVRRAATEIAEGCRAALAEMRTVLEVLSDAPAAPPQDGSGPDTVDALAAEARRVGQPVRVAGAPLRNPPDLIDRTVLRVVSEGLTNAVRHAPGAPTAVEVARSDDQVRVTVENERPTRPPTGLTTGGFGIDALRERISLLGGTLHAGPTDDGGFRLCAVLPGEDA